MQTTLLKFTQLRYTVVSALCLGLVISILILCERTNFAVGAPAQ